MSKINVSEAAKAVVRRNTEEVQGGGNFAHLVQIIGQQPVHSPVTQADK